MPSLLSCSAKPQNLFPSQNSKRAHAHRPPLHPVRCFPCPQVIHRRLHVPSPLSVYVSSSSTVHQTSTSFSVFAASMAFFASTLTILLVFVADLQIQFQDQEPGPIVVHSDTTTTSMSSAAKARYALFVLLSQLTTQGLFLSFPALTPSPHPLYLHE